MPVFGHLVVPALLALLCGAGAMAYYHPRDLTDALTGPDTPYILRQVTGPEDREQPGPDQGAWEPAPDPRFYVLTEPRQEDQEEQRRVKRHSGPSLSIVNSLDVLRQRLLLEIARRRMRQSEDQILANRELLKSIGKRDVHQSQRSSQPGNTRSSHASTGWPTDSRNQQLVL